MGATETRYVPRPVGSPTPEEVLEEMTPQEPYVVTDLVDKFEDAAKSTIRNRLEYLAQNDRVKRKKHASQAVTYRRLY